MTTPNDVIKADGFYVSYNDCDVGIYGSDTTALVVGQMEKFCILKGNHVESYRGVMAKGLDACLEYFRSNVSLKNKYSEGE